MRDCHSGQTIDQVKLYGNYVNWQIELAVPTADIEVLKYMRQMLIYGWERSISPIPGVVHINVPLRDPLLPVPHESNLQVRLLELLKSQLKLEEFLDGVRINTPLADIDNKLPILPEWQEYDRGIIMTSASSSWNAGAAWHSEERQISKNCMRGRNHGFTRFVSGNERC